MTLPQPWQVSGSCQGSSVQLQRVNVVGVDKTPISTPRQRVLAKLAEHRRRNRIPKPAANTGTDGVVLRAASNCDAVTEATESDSAPGWTEEEELQELRLTINRRERRRMQDLNIAMDGLR
ncbi:unnamed protein product [Protopolystoma xenopodis]|uniref:BHLH domain-containing protein n=1 Tax=Protopolystoma xenopodis TaxID=117903 RepID=A0A448X0F8_9PLAT|nr:unnamed protein product [Protopolystoma xenopodis]